MHVAFHIGTHCTDEDRLVRGLLKNKGKLASIGTAVPGPSRYRTILRDTVAGLNGAPATAEAQAVLLDALIEEEDVKRLVLSHENFLCMPDQMLKDGRFYPNAGPRVQALANLFPQNPTSFHLAIRSPATLLPALLARLPGTSYATLTQNTDITALLWSDVIARITHALPGTPVTVWCNEDSPLIWPEIVMALGQLESSMAVNGTYDLVSEIMSPEGMKWMQAYLANHKPQTAQQRRRIVSAFLTKFGLADKIQMELDMPGWTADLVEELNDTYEEDLLTIKSLPGVTFLDL